MPIYDYRCDDCGRTYDVFHKVREVEEDILCPSCGSAVHTRLIGAPSFSMSGKSAGPLRDGRPSCADGSCCGGTCSLN
jgi:putative FmdB family regulatory protein